MKREPRIGMRKRRQGSEQVLAVKFGGGVVMFGRLGILSSQILSSLILSYLPFFSLLSSQLSFFLLYSALFSCCRFHVFPSLPFFVSFLGCVP